ncbi:alpha/beta hydrolase [Leptobacterium sp. I13]|uniref:alpha/beta fold hydrolase n=1 Tax=Leptobacterium meishanense TaxID=3128904 RepID=UPI0030EBD67E
MKLLKKILKYTLLVLGFVFIVLLVLFYRFSAPKTNEAIQDFFSDEGHGATIRYLEFENKNVRVVTTEKAANDSLPTIIFIHGSVGSSMDFKKYMVDPELNNKAHLIAYDRIGYGEEQTGSVLNSIEKETALLRKIAGAYASKEIILVGYSYGGPIALNYALEHPTKHVVLCAPALYAAHEKIPGMIKLYQWKATRFLVPDIWKGASIEKLSHAQDLRLFENSWKNNIANITSIHGDSDWVVPYENSLELQGALSTKSFRLVTIEGEGHALLWTSFALIKKSLLTLL